MNRRARILIVDDVEDNVFTLERHVRRFVSAGIPTRDDAGRESVTRRFRDRFHLQRGPRHKGNRPPNDLGMPHK